MKIETYSVDVEIEDSMRVYREIEGWAPEFMPDPLMLPKLGVIVRDEKGEGIVYMCADMSNSVPRAFLDTMQTNPEQPFKTRFKACEMAVRFLKERLKDHGYVCIMSATPHPGVAVLAQKLGFTIEDTPLVHIHSLI